MTDLWATPVADDPGGRFTRPCDLDAERILAASVMARPDLIDELAEDFDPSDFSTQHLAWVWHAVEELRSAIADGPVPWHQVDRQLRKWHADGYLPIVPADAVRLAELYDHAQPASAAWYASRITKTAAAARLVDLGIRAQQQGMSPGFDPEADVAATQGDLDTVIRGNAASAPTLIASTIDAAIERAVTPPTAESRIPTGLTDLDLLMGGGFAPGRLIIVGARPGVGKTTLGQGFARAAAITNHIPTLFNTLEMSNDEITNGVLSAESRVGYHHINHGTTDNHGVRRLIVARERIVVAPLYIDDSTTVSLPSLRGQIRNLVRTAGLRLVIVDYLQLMQAPRAESRQVAVAALSRGLKLMAKEFGITIIVLSQLNRASEQRTDKKPTIADLRESGAVEQDADMVILVHRPDMHEPESPRAGEVDLIVDKHRGGPRSTITAAAQMHYAQFADMARNSNESPFDEQAREAS